MAAASKANTTPVIAGTSNNKTTLFLVFSHAVVVYVAFQIGSFYGDSMYHHDNDAHYDASSAEFCSHDNHDAPEHVARTESESAIAADVVEKDDDFEWKIPEEMSELIGGVARVRRDAFLRKFDSGQPLEQRSDSRASDPGNQDVLILYDSINGVPNKHKKSPTVLSLLSAEEATENCRILKVMTVDPDRNNDQDKVCIAIQGNNAEPHYHIHKWIKQSDGSINTGNVSFTSVSRYKALPHSKQFNSKTYVMDQPPSSKTNVKEAFSALQHYLSIYEDVKKKLEPLAKKVASASLGITNSNDGGKNNNLLVVMVCSKAHAELLVNFVCAARSLLDRDMPLSLNKILVFSTDTETHQLATSLGLASFYHAQLFQTMPAGVAADGPDMSYGSMDYARFMMAKVWTTHLVSSLGFDFVFQDVDIIPYQSNYLNYLVSIVANTKYPGFDLYFQDDHSDLPQYAPWSANSGFFYSRNNPRTQYFWSALIRKGDVILKNKSHQAAMAVLLSAVSNHYALRVKVLSNESHDFPVGYHFHQDHSFMKDMMLGKVKPHLFHMNWNTDVATKKKFSQQIGAWFVKDACPETATATTTSSSNAKVLNCCLAEATPVCYYRDKPSKLTSCKQYPAIEHDVSFW